MYNDILIRKQKISIHAHTEQLAFSCRQWMNDRGIDELTKMYERLFKNSSSDNYITINSLHIDLGRITQSDFENHFVALVEQKLIEELKDQFQAVFPNPHTFEAEDTSTQSYTNNQESALQYTTESQQNKKALLYFLEHGIYPWWYKKEKRKAAQELLDDFDSTEQTSFWVEIITKLQHLDAHHARQLMQRLMKSLNESVIEKHIHSIADLFSDASIKLNINTILEQRNELSNTFHIPLAIFYRQVLSFILIHGDQTDFVKEFLQTLKEQFPLSVDDQTQEIQLKTNSSDSKAMVSTSSKQTDKTKFPEEGIYVENAGLVIFHPFLPMYFQSLGLLNGEDQFISAEAQAKAAVLLYYLQCSNEEYKEWEMPLNKILCGIPINDILTDGIILSENEKQETKTLLQSVVDYWKALRGASLEALQNTFILREGKISYRDDYWLIQVERSGVDILLERLPWGIGTIKLPWLKELIHTEW